MQPGANVKSVEALESFRAALGLFGDEADQALTMALAHAQRFLNWLEHDQLAYWKREVRAREERLAEAKTDLHRCLAATIDPNRTPSCYQEKKVVEMAKRRLGEAENKLSAVHRWIPIVKQALMDYRLRVEPLASALVTDVPRARGELAASVARLLAYLNLEGPRTVESQQRSDDGVQASMTRPVAETAEPADDAARHEDAIAGPADREAP